jgi:hypothetical protein
MAVPSNTIVTAGINGIREDLADAIYDISPIQTPFLSMAPRGKAAARYCEWQVDSLAAATTNAHIEGDDSSANAHTATTRPGNRVQILKKVVAVSGTTEAVNKAGRRSEMAYQLQKRAKEIKRDLEKALTGNSGTTSGSTASAATMAGLESWLTSNIAYAAAQGAATTPGYSSGSVSAPVDPTVTGAFTESLMRNLVKSVFTAGGQADMLIVGPFNKQKVSQNFAGIATLYRDTAPKIGPASIIGAADIYVSDFSGQGGIKVIADLFTREQTALLVDFDYVEVAYLRPFMTEQLAKTGDNEKRHILTEVTLKVLNEAAHGKVVGLTTS